MSSRVSSNQANSSHFTSSSSRRNSSHYEKIFREQLSRDNYPQAWNSIQQITSKTRSDKALLEMVRRNPLHPYTAKAAREISSSSSQDEAYFLIAQAKLTLGDYEGVFKASNRIYSSVSTKQIASNVVERIQNLNGRSFSQEGPLVELALEHTHDLYSKMEVLKALKEKYVSLNNFSAASRIDEKLQNVRQRIQNGENLVLGIAGIVAGAVIASPLIIATTAIALPVMAAVAVPVVATGAIVTAAVLPIAAVVGAVAIPTIVLTGAIAAAVIPPVAMLATAGIVGYAALSILF